MSWHYSLALEEAFSGACSSDGAPSALWRSVPSALDDSCSDKMKGTCHRSLFGMMFVPLTDAHGEALLTWFRAASLARTSALQEMAQESRESEVGSGGKWPASFARYNRDTHSWRTAQLSLFEDLERSLETWPRWGWMQGGECSAQSTSVPHIDEKESGLWPTPRAANPGSRPSGGGGRILAEEVLIAEGIRERGRKIVPTPRVQMHRTPTEDRLGPDSINYHSNLEEFACGQLNPTWVEWLMGWPIGWTDSKQLATDRFQQWLRLHGRRYDDEARDHK